MSNIFLQSLSASDIASLAGVSRGAVSNWRRRHDDFPQPIQDSESVRFDALEVRQWLKSYGYDIKTPATDEALWSIALAVRDQLETTPFAHLVTALIAIRKQKQQLLADINLETAFIEISKELELESKDQFTRSFDLLQRSGSFDEAQAVIDSIPIEDFGAIADKLLERRGFGRSFESSGLNPASSQVLAGAVDQLPSGATILDLACGRAGTLFDVAARQDNPVHLYGSDVFEFSLDIARLRAFLHDVRATFKCADVLNEDPFPGLKADAVVIESPFGLRHEFNNAIADPRWLVTPRSISTDIAWVQLAASYLSDRGRGYVLTSTVPLARSGAIQHARAELVRSGLVEAIVALPRALAYGTSIATAVWVLSRNATRHHVLFIDASQEDVNAINIAQWLAEPHSAPENRSIPIRELLTGSVDLTPQIWVIPKLDITAQTDRIAASAQSLTAALDSLTTQKVPALATDLPKAPLVSLGALEERDFLKIKAVRGHEHQNSTVLSSAKLHTGIIDIDFAKHHDLEIGVSLPLPRILVSTIGGIKCAVDEAGIAYLSSDMSIIEVDGTRLDPYYMAALLMASRNKRFLQGAAMRGARVTDLEIPLLPLEAQRKVAESIRTGWQLRKVIRRANSEVTELLNSYIDYTAEITNPR
ncbi:N-6 DNA methylase [Actinomyces sp.]|uniref:N-6 DNA methylase n=1 Tax=Actinomyces sp. TaxID=29317 RepID=UPI0029103FAE|nr:N-6 DNA methylase [Actinomyces sp.]MDU6678743.1 N-6 DNA methylase [Actinomyces sp.]